VLAAAITGTLLVARLRSRASVPIVVAAAAAYGVNALAFAWFPVAKTYAIATAPLYAAHVIASGAGRRWSMAALTGALCAAAVAARINMLVAVPFVLATLYAASQSNGRFRLLVATLAMVACGGLLAIPLFLAPSSALYSTIGYHLGRTGSAVAPVVTISDSLQQKWIEIQKLLLVSPEERAAALQLLMLLAAVAFGSRGRRRGPAMRIALVIFVVSMLLQPTHVQYLCMMVPFLIEAVALGMPSVNTTRRRAVAALAATAYAVAAIADLYRFTVSGHEAPGIDGMPHRWRIASVLDASKRISAVARGDAVLSSWPGYLVESSARPWPGTENHFTFDAGDRVPNPDERRTFHLVSTDDAIGLIRDRKVPVLAFGSWSADLRGPLRNRDLPRAYGYRTCTRNADVVIFALPDRCPAGMDEGELFR